jgi:hypothetical protein
MGLEFQEIEIIAAAISALNVAMSGYKSEIRAANLISAF